MLQNHTSEGKFSTSETASQDLHEGRVMPPQQAAIIMYSNKTITHVSRALSCKHNISVTLCTSQLLVI
jgi:hypothetical protein